MHMLRWAGTPIQRFRPLSRHPPGTLAAVVCSAEASEPLLGSVRPHAPAIHRVC